MRAWRAAALLALGLALAAPAGGGESAFVISTRPVEVPATDLKSLVPRGAWVLTANHRAFGGLSGLVIADGGLVAVTDEGWLLTARIGPGDGAPDLAAPRLVPLTEADGSPLGKEGGDAEGIALLGGQLFVAFERDHRIAPVSPDGRLGSPFTLPEFEHLPSNAGIEGLASADGALLAIPETSADGAFPVHALGADGRLLGRGLLPAPPPHRVTGADVGPDGRLYVVLRDFSILRGVSIRVRRYPLAGSPPLPDADAGETLAAFGHGSGIDNMEAIALWRDEAGRLRLWLLSDDNFNPLQRTLLLDFEVTG